MFISSYGLKFVLNGGGGGGGSEKSFLVSIISSSLYFKNRGIGSASKAHLFQNLALSVSCSARTHESIKKWASLIKLFGEISYLHDLLTKTKRQWESMQEARIAKQYIFKKLVIHISERCNQIWGNKLTKLFKRGKKATLDTNNRREKKP